MGLIARLKRWIGKSKQHPAIPDPVQVREHLTLPLDHPHRYASTLAVAARKRRKIRNKMQLKSRRINRRGKHG